MSVDEQLMAIKANNEKVMQQLYMDNFDRVKQFVLRNNGTLNGECIQRKLQSKDWSFLRGVRDPNRTPRSIIDAF